MTVYRIPTSTDATLPFYYQRTTLDGIEYLLRFRWNDRAGAWSMDLHDHLDDPIASGVRIVPGWDLLRRVIDSRRPPGKLMALDLAGAGSAPGLTELGDIVVLYYFDAAELA